MGSVEVVASTPKSILFKERGTWQAHSGIKTSFYNVFRWTLHEKSVALEHLRRGPQEPVFLFHLQEDHPNEFVSAAAHLCQADCYTGKVTLSGPIALPHEANCISIASAGAKIYVADLSQNAVYIVDTQANNKITAINVGNEPRSFTNSSRKFSEHIQASHSCY